MQCDYVIICNCMWSKFNSSTIINVLARNNSSISFLVHNSWAT